MSRYPVINPDAVVYRLVNEDPQILGEKHSPAGVRHENARDFRVAKPIYVPFNVADMLDHCPSMIGRQSSATRRCDLFIPWQHASWPRQKKRCGLRIRHDTFYNGI